MLMTDERYPLSVVVAVRLTPAPSEDRVRQALLDLQARHGALRARIESAGRSPAFVHDGSAAGIPLEVRSDPSAWMDVCTERLNGRVPPDRAPLMDVVLLGEGAAAPGCRLVVRFHHAMVDGWVVGRLLTDLVHLLGRSDPQTVGAPEPLDIEAVERAPFRPSLAKRLGFLAREMKGERAFARASRTCAKAPHPTPGPCRAHARSLSAEETRALMRACRTRGLPVQAAVSAAMLRATLRQMYRETVRPMRAISFADLRSALPSPCDRSVGAHVGMLRHTFVVDARRPLHELAEACAQRVAASMRRGEAMTAAALSPLAMRLVLRRQGERMADTALSYLGPIEVPEVSGEYAVTDVHAFISSNPQGPVLSGFGHLFGRGLSLGFMTMVGDMDAGLADTLVDQVMGDLVSFAEP